MFISNKVKYGMKALIYISNNYKNDIVSACKISKELNIPKEFISKIMQSLVYHGILKSKKGKGGGFYLAVSPEDIKYEIVLRILGYQQKHSECLFDMSNLCERKTCPFCENWKEFINNFNSTIKNYSITGDIIK